MSRLTNQKREEILKDQTKIKFYDVLKISKDNLIKEMTKDVIKTVPTWITQKMVDSGFIKISSSIEDLGSYGSRECYENVMNEISLNDCFPSKCYEHTIKITPKIKKYAQIIVEINEEKDKFYKELRSLLNSFSSDKKLIESIPELKKYFKDDCKKYALVPVARINKLRKQLI